MSTRAEVLLWAQRVISRKGGPPHVMLEVNEDASADEVQETFHQIARTAHPDLHRHGLAADELELVTSAYAAVAGAYQEMRYQALKSGRIHKVTPPAGVPTGARPITTGSVPKVTAVPAAPAAPSGPAPAGNAAQQMSSKAIIYYRKAELCLKRGDLRGAVLQIKLAIAADPVSTFLRTALAEVESEVRKPT